MAQVQKSIIIRLRAVSFARNLHGKINEKSKTNKQTLSTSHKLQIAWVPLIFGACTTRDSRRVVILGVFFLFFPADFPAKERQLAVYKSTGKNLVHNLQYGPQTRLVRGIY